MTIGCLVKIDTPLKQKGGKHQMILCGVHCVRYHDPIGS